MSRAQAAEPAAGRLTVRSPDGTQLAVWAGGEGPPIVLVHGSLCDHRRLEPLAERWREGMTVYAMDRRGFGDSGDAAEYALEREFEDVAAVVDAVAERHGGRVSLWGHSYGASCAMGGAVATDRVHRLVLYEPSLGLTYPPGSVDAVERALEAGDREAAIRLVFTGILGMSEEDIAARRAGPLWEMRVAAAPTVPRECRAEEGWTYRPCQFEAITAPTLILTGSNTPLAVAATTRAAAEAIPQARVHVLEGHGHVAFESDPGLVAAVTREFVASAG